MSRKRNLVDFGFRLPSAVDNRPLTWEEFTPTGWARRCTCRPPPDPLELGQSGGEFVEQVIRPDRPGRPDGGGTWYRPKGQIDDLTGEIADRAERDERSW